MTMSDNIPVVPIELWRTILSWLPFRDQLNFRLVSKDWMDSITSLPEFKKRNCFSLGYCMLSENDPPVKALMNSKLTFASLIVHQNQMKLEFSPTLITFFTKIGTTVTYLDISQGAKYLNDSGIVRFIVENLNLFQVLHHFNVGLVTNWFDVAVPRSIRQKAKSHASDLSSEERLRKKMETINIKKAIAEDTDNMKSRVNTSVRVISIEFWKETYEDIELMFGLVPNVQEINIVSPNTHNCGRRVPESFYEVLKNHSEKITSLPITCTEDVDYIEKLNLSNLKQLTVKMRDASAQLVKQMIDRCIESFPTIKTISTYTSSLPQSHFDYIVDINIHIKLGDQVDLTGLTAFKKLEGVFVLLIEVNNCFFSHHPVPLNTIKKFTLVTWFTNFCPKCTESILQSLPNVRELNVSDPDGQCINQIFKHNPNLEVLKIVSFNTGNSFVPNNEWPELKWLRYLALSFDYEIGGDKELWENFEKKLNRLKYIDASAGQSIDLIEMIGSNMPALQKIWISVPNKRELIEIRQVEGEGRKFFIKKLGN